MDRAALPARAADSGLPHLAQRARLLQGDLQGTQLAVGGGRVLHLGLHEIRPGALAAMLLEHKTPYVTQLKLAQLPQVACAGAHARALAEGPGQRFQDGASIGAGRSVTITR